MEPGVATMPAADERARLAEDASAALERLRPRLLRLALVLRTSPEDAEDAVQETLLAAYRNRSSFDPATGSPESWTAAILLRRLRNRKRGWLRRIRFLSALGREPERRAVPGSEAIEARLTLARLLDALTPRQREVVALYEIAEWSAEETARVLGMTPAGVRSVARDARRRLSEAAAGGKEASR